MIPFELVSKSKLDCIALLWCWGDRDIFAIILQSRGDLKELADDCLKIQALTVIIFLRRHNIQDQDHVAHDVWDDGSKNSQL